MRLISKFRDYYDSAQVQGVDLTRVFVRNRAEMSSASRSSAEVPLEARRFLEFAKPRVPQGRQVLVRRGARQLELIEFGLIFFAGALYPFAKVEVCDRKTYRFNTETYHTFDTLASALSEFGVDLRKADRDSIGLEHLRDRQVEPFFKLASSTEMFSKAIEDGLCIAVYQPRYDQLEVNPCLANFQLFKVLPAWQAYQELDMYVGSLAAPDRLPVTVSDEDRIFQHGFDKLSFRKAPQS